MNQLRPILRGNPTQVQRLVLGSAKLDQPPSHGKSQTLAALGLGGTLVAATQTAGAVTAVSASSTTAVTAAGPVISLGLAGLKGIAVGLLAGTVVYGLIVSVGGGEQQSAQPSEPQPGLHKSALPRGDLAQLKNSRAAVGVPPTTKKPDVVLAPFEAVAASASAPTSQATESTPKLAASAETLNSPQGRLPGDPLPPAVSSADWTSNSPKSSRGTAARLASDSATQRLTESATIARGSTAKLAEQSLLESEIAILDSAQRALAAGQPSGALQNLDTHRRLFAKPHLLPEATLVRIEALLALGRAVEARRLGEQLLAAQPAGALSQRVRSLLNQPSKP